MDFVERFKWLQAILTATKTDFADDFSDLHYKKKHPNINTVF